MRGTPKITKRKGSPYLQITFSEGRRSRRFSTCTDNREQADRILAQFILERKKPQITEIYINDMLTQYESFRPNDKAVGYHMKHLKPFFDGMFFSQFGRHTVRDYTNHRLRQQVIIGKNKGSKTVSPATVRRELDTLSATFYFAKKEEYIAEVPAIEKPAANPPRERWLTPDEVIRLFDAAKDNERLTAYLHLAINTAARPSSILELKWFQVDLEQRLIHFNPEGRQQTAKHRPTVVINNSLMDFLPSWRKECRSEYVCGGVRSLKKGFKLACQKAGISGATPYTLRHTALTWAVREGHSLALAGQLAGHKDPRTTMRYAKHDPSFTAGVVASLATGAQLAHLIAEKDKKQQNGEEKVVVKQ